MRFILRTDLPGPTYLAALYSGENKEFMVTQNPEDACSYSEFDKADEERKRLKRLFGITSFVTFSLFEWSAQNANKPG